MFKNMNLHKNNFPNIYFITRTDILVGKTYDDFENIYYQSMSG